MPYFIYKIHPNQRLEAVEARDKYPEARDLARAMRKDIAEEDAYTVKIIYASDTTEAERLLQEKREPRPLGDE